MVKGLARSLSRGTVQRQQIIKQTYTLKDLAIVINGATGIGFGSAVLGDLPEGNIVVLGAVSYIQVVGAGGQAGLSDTWAGDYGIGTTPASDGTLTAGDIDVVDSTALAAATAEVSPRTRGVNATANAGAILDNTDGSLELNISVLVDDLDISANGINATIDGELHILYAVLGDD